MSLLECILLGGGAGLVIAVLSLLFVYWPAKDHPEVVSLSLAEARRITRNVEDILALTTAPDTLRRAIRALEDFESTILMLHNGRRLPPDDAELLSAIRAGIAKLRTHVTTPVVSP